jgi:hypothetical protein
MPVSLMSLLLFAGFFAIWTFVGRILLDRKRERTVGVKPRPVRRAA